MPAESWSFSRTKGHVLPFEERPIAQPVPPSYSMVKSVKLKPSTALLPPLMAGVPGSQLSVRNSTRHTAAS